MFFLTRTLKLLELRFISWKGEWGDPNSCNRPFVKTFALKNLNTISETWVACLVRIFSNIEL